MDESIGHALEIVEKIMFEESRHETIDDTPAEPEVSMEEVMLDESRHEAIDDTPAEPEVLMEEGEMVEPDDGLPGAIPDASFNVVGREIAERPLIEDENLEDAIPNAELVDDRPIRYDVIQKGTRLGARMLVSSEGFSYNVKDLKEGTCTTKINDPYYAKRDIR